MIQQPLNIDYLLDFDTFLLDGEINERIRDKMELPSNEEIEELIEYLEVTANLLYFNFANSIYPFCYLGESFAYITLNSLDLEVNKQFHTKERIEQTEKQLHEYYIKNEWGSYFSMLDKPARIPAFIHMYENEKIPHEQIMETFVDVYTMNEFGLGVFSNEVIMNIYDFHESLERRERMRVFYKEAELHENHENDLWVDIYRGCTEEGTYAYSWTFDKDVAKMFANRVGGDVYRARILKGDVLDYLFDRGESEVIVIKDNLEDVRKVRV